MMKRTTLIKTLLISGLAMGAAGAASATAPGPVSGQWVLNPAACPDLVEDRRDARITISRRDAREDRRDARVTNCPASAYTFIPARGNTVYVAPRAAVPVARTPVRYVTPVRKVPVRRVVTRQQPLIQVVIR